MRVAVVAGFQGISPEGRVATLGRGGSDTTAVAFAAAFGAERCDIYTDVDGVYTTDPRVSSRARKLDRIAYEEMLELASLGAKVLQTRSVELAMRYKVRLRVLSSFEDMGDEAGTLVCAEEDIMESNVVAGVAFVRDEAKMTLISVADRPGVSAAIFGPLAEAGVNVDMIVQNIAEDGRTDMTFSLPVGQIERAEKAVREAMAREEINFHDLISDRDVSKVSVVGIGMRSHAGVAARMFAALSAEGINIKVITTSEIKISRADRPQVHGTGGAGAARHVRAGEGVAEHRLRRHPEIDRKDMELAVQEPFDPAKARSQRCLKLGPVSNWEPTPLTPMTTVSSQPDQRRPCRETGKTAPCSTFDPSPDGHGHPAGRVRGHASRRPSGTPRRPIASLSSRSAGRRVEPGLWACAGFTLSCRAGATMTGRSVPGFRLDQLALAIEWPVVGQLLPVWTLASAAAPALIVYFALFLERPTSVRPACGAWGHPPAR